ncbi:MAG: hypothetical protein HOV79_15420, partial [Hamadaea sp.]|nr:hypothetical protein [Hamadaea sp.]
RILFNELKSGQAVVVDCEGDPNDIENAKLVFFDPRVAQGLISAS